MVRCSKAQYFSYIIDSYGRVRGCGYNGTPAGMTNCVNGGCPRAVNNVPSGTDYNSGPGLCYAIHAEANAIIGLDRKILQDSTLYVNGICCFGCAKEIAGSGIRRVVGLDSETKPVDFLSTLGLFEAVDIEWLLADQFGYLHQMC